MLRFEYQANDLSIRHSSFFGHLMWQLPYRNSESISLACRNPFQHVCLPAVVALKDTQSIQFVITLEDA